MKFLQRLLKVFIPAITVLLKLLGTQKEKKMRGPIIEEHVTNGTVVSAGAIDSIYVKSDGRALRVYAKALVTGTAAVTLSVRPVAHFSDAKEAIDWPVISANNTDGIVAPDEGDHALSGSAGNKEFCVMVAKTWTASEYKIDFATAAGASCTGVYVVTELV